MYTGHLHLVFQILAGTTKKTEPKRVLSFLLLVVTLDVTFFSPENSEITKMALTFVRKFRHLIFLMNRKTLLFNNNIDS